MRSQNAVVVETEEPTDGRKQRLPESLMDTVTVTDRVTRALVETT